MAISVRFAKPSDADGVLAIYAPYCEVTCVSFEISAPTRAQMRDRIQRVTEQFPWLVCEIDNELVGYTYASQHRERAAYRWAVDVAVYVAEAHQRCGIARALYNALIATLREQGYFKAHAGITLPNDKSVGLHKSLGFRQVGLCPHVGYKHGKWLDVAWWQLDLQPERSDPSEPLAIGKVQENQVVRQAICESARLIRERSLLRSAVGGI